MNDPVIVSAARLPIGKFGGALKDVSDWDLGTAVIKTKDFKEGVTAFLEKRKPKFENR